MTKLMFLLLFFSFFSCLREETKLENQLQFTDNQKIINSIVIEFNFGANTRFSTYIIDFTDYSVFIWDNYVEIYFYTDSCIKELRCEDEYLKLFEMNIDDYFSFVKHQKSENVLFNNANEECLEYLIDFVIYYGDCETKRFKLTKTSDDILKQKFKYTLMMIKLNSSSTINKDFCKKMIKILSL